jgi:hypothetical protein
MASAIRLPNGNLFVFFMVFAAFYFHAALQAGMDSLPLLCLYRRECASLDRRCRYVHVGLAAARRCRASLRRDDDPHSLSAGLVSTMGLAFITILVPLSCYDILKVQPRLSMSLVISALLLGGLTLAGRTAQAC